MLLVKHELQPERFLNKGWKEKWKGMNVTSQMMNSCCPVYRQAKDTTVI
jgi:hypothetical protein